MCCIKASFDSLCQTVTLKIGSKSTKPTQLIMPNLVRISHLIPRYSPHQKLMLKKLIMAPFPQDLMQKLIILKIEKGTKHINLLMNL